VSILLTVSWGRMDRIDSVFGWLVWLVALTPWGTGARAPTLLQRLGTGVAP